ncbi:plant self-incompatibility protein S1 family protein [Medicago truncatula]|uniref:S-protein homolog n=1 Tax=Medicago truncatula TaxID=3880 RepID=G7JUG7_MEDTR|nr:plant self-incompatibility protein S1 family protein [Medicago truncatula]
MAVPIAFVARETIAIGFSSVKVTKARKAIAIGRRKVTVYIINKVYAPYPTNPTSLNVHCKSKDDNLGIHILNFGGLYKFSFKPQFIPIRPTLFSCNFTWPQNPNIFHLDVYNQKHNKCHDLEILLIYSLFQQNCSLGLYNSLVERCFNNCVKTFYRSSLNKLSSQVSVKFSDINQGASTTDKQYWKLALRSGSKYKIQKNPEGNEVDLGGCDLGYLEGEKWLYFQQ